MRIILKVIWKMKVTSNLKMTVIFTFKLKMIELKIKVPLIIILLRELYWKNKNQLNKIM
jgi:hypothetical protein